MQTQNTEKNRKYNDKTETVRKELLKHDNTIYRVLQKHSKSY